MAVCIPTYMLASGLISGHELVAGVAGTVTLGNLIVWVPMALIGHAGTKYGITFPVFARASFGTAGTHIASVLRGVVACGWFGIQTWIGGFAIYKLALLQWPGLAETAVIGVFSSEAIQVNVAQFVCFLLFWAIECRALLARHGEHPRRRELGRTADRAWHRPAGVGLPEGGRFRPHAVATRPV